MIGVTQLGESHRNYDAEFEFQLSRKPIVTNNCYFIKFNCVTPKL